jgi:N-acetylmuramoyl-L-alanine amidase
VGRILLLTVLLPATVWSADFYSVLTNVYDLPCVLTGRITFTSNSVTLAGHTAQFTNAPTLRFKRIVLDPGHIGGEWARMEERFFVIGKDRPVQEAVLNLTVARLLQRQLEAAGVTVFLTKTDYQPVTTQRPEDFRAQAEHDVPANADEANRADAVRKRMEILFYRSAEIAARAKLVNEIKPDLTLCLHFNAVEWNDCHDLVDDNSVIVFTHGNYLPGELADDEQKLRLLQKLTERSHEVEQPVAEALASALGHATGLPTTVRARNLAANRLYDGPVVYLEPYYMNNRLVYQRIQLGDYDGEKTIDGKSYRSIFREYADAVMAGLSKFIAR